HLSEVEESQKRTRRELALKVDEYALLDALVKALGACETRPDAARAVLQLTRRLVPSQSVVVFAPGDDGLVPIGHESPHNEVLASLTLLAVREPVVERAWAEGKAAVATVDEMRSSQVIQD